MDHRTPKAKQLVAIMQATMNIDLWEMNEAGVIDGKDGQECSPWTKWNDDAPMFIVKLDARKLNALAALISHKFPGAFGYGIEDLNLVKAYCERINGTHDGQTYDGGSGSNSFNHACDLISNYIDGVLETRNQNPKTTEDE